MEEQINYRLINQYQQIEVLLDGLSSDFLITRHQADKWSIQENLAHVGRYQEIFIQRISRIIKEEQPNFGRYSADKDRYFKTWVKKEVAEIISSTKTDRKEIVEMLSNFKAQDFNRIGVHPKLGEMTIINWTEFFLLHESHHFYTIFWLINEYKVEVDRSF